MAAQEYYMGTQSVHELPGNQLHTSYAQQPQRPPQALQYQQPPARPQYNAPTYSNTPPPAYSTLSHQSPQQKAAAPQPYPSPSNFLPEKHQHHYAPEKPQLQQQQPQLNLPPPAIKPANPPYPSTPPATSYYAPPKQHTQNGYLGAPLQPIRSHSQPARVRFADQESTLLGETSSSGSDSSDSSTHHHRRRRQGERKHRSSRRGDSSSRDHRSRSRSRSRERSRDRERRHKHHHSHHRETRTQEKEHKNRDTFLGAGAGTLIGDAIFPGLGTAAGLLLGGYGGRKYAERSASEDPREGSRRRRKDSGAEESEGEYRRRRR